MIVPVYSNRNTAKARFFAAYALSILLILVVFSFFFKSALGRVGSLLAAAENNEDPHAAVYEQLHRRMEGLDRICARVAKEKSAANLNLLQNESNAFFLTVDSLRNSLASRPNSSREKELTALLEAFSRAAEKQVKLAKGIHDDENAVGPAELNSQLLHKDQRIAELESQNKLLAEEKEKAITELQAKATAPVQVVQHASGSDAGGWKAQYERQKDAADRLKQSNEQYLLQTKQLRKSYKEVVEDNRRLLEQLQAARARN